MMLSGSDLVESFLRPGLWADEDVRAWAGDLLDVRRGCS